MGSTSTKQGQLQQMAIDGFKITPDHPSFNYMTDALTTYATF